MTTAAIIGAGDLGGAVAQALASRDSVARVLLVDAAGSAAAGKALDIQQMGAVTGSHTRLRGSSDISDTIGSSIWVIADRFGSSSAEWQGEEGRALLASLVTIVGDAPLICAGAGQADLLLRAVRDLRYRRQRVLGSATEAFASAIRSIVALEARCAPAEVTLSVLGAPDAGFVVPWSEASIGGVLIERILTPPQLARVETRVARLWPPRPYTLGLAASVVVEGALRSSRRAFNVLSLLDGELGIRGRVGSVSAFLDAGGIAGVRVPSLSARERVLLDTAMNA